MAETHLNAFIQEATDSIAAAKAAVKQAEAAVQGVIDRVNGQDPTPDTLPKEPGVSGAANEGEAQGQTKEVKYK